ncbi:uncharacterized protein [Malus domestica]|uniref:uncharacterized protein n=1 Tax=Malus domestica TaxID=3750 RepID=UPI00397616D6
MDFVGQIYPASSKGHTFIIVATNYFTKCVEASAVKSITSAVVKNFIETKILHRFRVPETIVTDRGPSFISKEVEEFASKYKIKMIQSSPYYPQSNGQAESSNKMLFGLHSEEYIEAMRQGIEYLDVARIEALNQIQEGKRAVAQAYNKKVKIKSFKEGDLVWKTVLPLGAQLRGCGKWSPTWECPFMISRVLDKGGYYLADLEGNWQRHPINVKFLKSSVSTSFLLSSWIEPDQVIGLCRQDEHGRGPSMRIVTRKPQLNSEEPIFQLREIKEKAKEDLLAGQEQFRA